MVRGMRSGFVAITSRRCGWLRATLVSMLVFGICVLTQVSALASLDAVATTAAGHGAAMFVYDGPARIAAATTVSVADAAHQAGLAQAGVARHVYDSPAYLYATNAARGVRGLAGAGDELAEGGVCALRDPVTGQVVRTGRTNDLIRRAGEHLRDPALADFEFEIVARTDIYAQQRGLEQLIHEAYSPPLNLIQPISPTNPNLTTYLDAADDFLSIYGGG